MRTLFLILTCFCTLACAAGPAPIDQPQAGSVGVVASALQQKDCQVVIESLASSLCVWGQPFGDTWWQYGYGCQPVYVQGGSQIVGPWVSTNRYEARKAFCGRLSGKLVETRHTVPWRKLNLTNTIVFY